jgi:hypothetical protein
MKRLFLLHLGFILVMTGYPQTRIHSPKNMRDKAVKVEKQYTNPSTKNEPEQFRKNGTKDPISEMIGETVYDLQTYSSCQNRIYLYDDGKIGATFTFGMNYAAFADRGTGYNFFNGVEWGPPPLERIESIKAGWPSYCPWGVNGEVSVSFYSTTTLQGLAVYKRATKGSGAWVSGILHSPEPLAELQWPRCATAGVNHEIIHVISLTKPVNYGGITFQGQNGALLYSRSSNGGTSWEIQNVILPGIDSSVYQGFSGDTYDMIAEDNNVAILIGDDWSEMSLLKSSDGGTTWNKTTIWNHPYPLWDPESPYVTDTFYCADGSHALAFDVTGKVHVVFGISKAYCDGNSQYWFPLVDGIVYWNEDRVPFSNHINALSPYGDPGSELIENYNLIGWMQDINGNGTINILGEPGIYNVGASSMPQLVIDEDNNMYLIYSSITETYNNQSQDYRHLWGRASYNGGLNWCDFIDLNYDLMYIFSECVYPSCSPTTDGHIHLVFQEDYEPGLAVIGDIDPYMPNNIIHLKVPKPDFTATAFVGSLSGYVTEFANGLPLSGATVSLDGTGFSATSNVDGFYFISNIPSGNYNAQCNKAGFYIQTEPVAIYSYQVTTQDFQLISIYLSPPQNLEAIVVNNDVILTWIEPGKTNAAGKINSIFKDEKNLLGYNVYRNGGIISFVTETEYTDENISPGSYEYFVTALYDEGESIPSNIVWVVGPEPCYPPQNVVAVVINQNQIQITWEPPVSGDAQGYNLYKNGMLMGYTTGLNCQFITWPGTYQFCVSSVCPEGESELTCCDSLILTYLAPPENLGFYYYSVEQIWLFWEPPFICGEWIEWDSGSNTGDGIGLTSGGTFSCASHWTTSDLSQYNGFILSKISFWPNGDPDALFVIKIWQGEPGTNLVYQHDVTNIMVDQWNEVDLQIPLIINNSTDLWFGYSVTHSAGTYPAGCDDGPAVQGKGDMISLGGAWESMSATYGLDYNWNIAGYVGLPEQSNLTKMTKPNEPVSIIDLPFDNFNSSEIVGVLNKKESKSLLGYNVYHSTDIVNFSLDGFTEETTYELNINPYNFNFFYVTAVYDEGESEPSDTIGFIFTSSNYYPDDNVRVSPVPTKDNLEISCPQIIKAVSFYDLYGQLLMNEVVFDKDFQFDVTNYKAGVYLLKIEIGSSIITRKIVIE